MTVCVAARDSNTVTRHGDTIGVTVGTSAYRAYIVMLHH